ncbi:MAG: COX15/CtaA family protein, partial [Chloroflexota bacterium]
MTRFQKLAAASVATTFLLVTIGVVVRATDSGTACPHWPGCFDGQFLPSLDQGFQVWIEWLHRTVAVVIGLLIVAMAAIAMRDHRDRPSIVWPSLAAVALVGYQGWLGRETVRLGNSGESVTAHLAAAMALVGLLVYVLVRSLYPARIGGRGSRQRFTLLAAFGAVATFALLLFGSNVTAANAWNVFPDWPLMGGTLLPPLAGEQAVAHVLHRWVAVVVGLIVAAIAIAAWR